MQYPKKKTADGVKEKVDGGISSFFESWLLSKYEKPRTFFLNLYPAGLDVISFPIKFETVGPKHLPTSPMEELFRQGLAGL